MYKRILIFGLIIVYNRNSTFSGPPVWMGYQGG